MRRSNRLIIAVMLLYVLNLFIIIRFVQDSHNNASITIIPTTKLCEQGLTTTDNNEESRKTNTGENGNSTNPPAAAGGGLAGMITTGGATIETTKKKDNKDARSVTMLTTHQNNEIIEKLGIFLDWKRSAAAVGAAAGGTINTTTTRDDASCSNQTLNRGEKVDVVIPWINYTSGYVENKNVPFDFGLPLDRIFKGIGLNRSPWTEICWTVRSYLYWDKDSVLGNIYIVYNGYRHEPPDCFQGLEQVIPMPQQLFLHGTMLDTPDMSSPRPGPVWAHMHRIPGLRQFFIFPMDDIFLLQPLDLGIFYDFDAHTILSHLTGGKKSFSAGTYESNIALEKYFHKPSMKSDGLHVPYLMQRCRMAEIEKVFGPAWNCTEPKHLCNFDNYQFHTMNQCYNLLAGAARNTPPGNGFAEVHTTNTMQLGLHLDSLQKQGVSWVDIQGVGVSDEYIPKEFYTSAIVRTSILRLRREFDEWLQAQPFFSYNCSIVKNKSGPFHC